MHVPALFCADCGCEMVVRKNGVGLEAMAKHGGIFKIRTDAWVCNSCGRMVYFGHRREIGGIGCAVESWEETYHAIPVHDRVEMAEVRGHYVGQFDHRLPVPPFRGIPKDRQGPRA